MNDMVTRVAHELTGHINGVCCHKTGGANNDPKCECRVLARAAIEAMRVLTPEMRDAAAAEHVEDFRLRHETFEAQWNAAIDAAG